MNEQNRQYRSGIIAFSLSGICAISAGIIVSLLRDRYHFSFSLSGTLISTMSIGNMAALLISGILPASIGEMATTLLLSSGYCLGYMMMAVSGKPILLVIAFLLAGIAKGCTANKSTILVGKNAADRTRSLNLMNAGFSFGALLSSFMVSGLQKVNHTLPMIGLSVVGLVLWVNFLFSGLPGREAVAGGETKRYDNRFLKNTTFWLLAMLLFCQNAAEYTVNGWMVTYYKNERILTGVLAAYTVTVQWSVTLIARLLLAYAIKIRKPFKALAIMGTGLTVAYGLLLRMHTAVPALIALGLFSFSVAGVSPIAVACTGSMMNSASVGLLLAIGGIGGIAFPWLVGIIADAAGLRSGMAINLIPCIGMVVVPVALMRKRKPEDAP